jgi:signal transduction histidine kinase/ligand-binding sensor domain-containing protein
VAQALGRVRKVVALSVLLAGILPALPRAFALDPSLDISQYAHTSWKIRDGFVRGAIFAIAQTPDGYLWLGTESGLVRFDGVRAVPWQPPGGERLPGNFVNVLLVARDGTLWIGTHKGLASWKDGRLRKYPEIAGPTVNALLEDHEGSVWIGGGGISGGNLCAARGGKIQCYGAGSFGGAVAALYEDHNGNLWLSAQTGLWRWTGSPEHYSLPRGGTGIEYLTEDNSGAIVLSTLEGLEKLVGGKIESYALPGVAGQFQPTHLLRSSDGSLWVGSWQGLLHLHQGRADVFKAADGLSADFVAPIFEDREGNVWVGTQDGLDRFRDVAAPTISRNQGLSNSAAWSVQAMPDGSIWITTADGLNRWKNGHVTVYRSQTALSQSGQKDEQEIAGSGAATEIVNSGLTGQAQSMGQDQRGRLWAATSDGVFYFESGPFIRVPGVPGRYTSSVVGDRDGNVWISNGKAGLFQVTPQLVVRSIPWSQFGHSYSTALLPDRLQGALWLGFADGGIAHLKNGQILRSYSPAEGLGNGMVSGLRFGSDGALWAATEGGLSRIKDGQITTLTSRNGLPCDAVHWLMEDDDHAVWLYKPCGLARIARSELDAWVNDSQRVVHFTILDAADGVRSYEIPSGYPPMVTKSRDGKIWFLSRDGVGVIDPRHLPYNKVPPPVYIEQITADRKAYDPTSYGNGRVPLPALIRDLEIDYTALSLVAPEKVHFRYKLEGRDSDWQDAGTRRQAFYTNLPPRNYRFRIKACNNSGVWNEAGTSLDFSVAPAYYQTMWFRSSCVIAFLALLAALYQLRLRQVARQFNMTLEARVSERTRIARELHDTLLQSFQGTLLKFHALTYMLLDRPEVQKRLETAIEQARQAVTEGRDAVQSMRSTTLVGNDLARTLVMLGEGLAAEHGNGRAPEFCVQVQGTTRELAPLVRDDAYRIASEALRNAFLHAHAARIEVEIRYDPRQLRLRVRDNGKGIDPKVLEAGARAGHYGLPGMRERAKLVGGKLAVWSELDSGTEAELTIPASIAYAKSRAAHWPRFWKKGA